MKRLSVVFLAGAILLTVLPCTKATWSICVVDMATGEVAVAGATCVAQVNLRGLIAVIVSEHGVGAAQSLTNDRGRRTMTKELLQATPPDQILYMINWEDMGDANRQYGLVDRKGHPITFTGVSTGPWAGGVAARAGSLAYAIQGNVLVDERVVLDAESALVQTRGPLPQRMIAAMNAAARAGGDRRCRSHRKSAHTAFLAVARTGDRDVRCPLGGCADGDYFVELDVADTVGSDPDPVFTLSNLYEEWKWSRRGRPDQLASRWTIEPPILEGDGAQEAVLRIYLADYFDRPLEYGGLAVDVAHDDSSARATHIGPVVDKGDGTYDVHLTSNGGIGEDVFRVTVQDQPLRPGKDPYLVTLYPFPTLQVISPLRLFGSLTKIRQRQTDKVELALLAPPNMAARVYIVLGSISGTTPGLDVGGGLTLPLVLDPFLMQSWTMKNVPPFVNTLGQLDSNGDAIAFFEATSAQLEELIGVTLNFAWMTLGPTDATSTPFRVEVVE